MFRIYPVELAAELETGSRLPTGEYTPPDTTQLDSSCSVINFSSKSVGSRRELVANSTTHRSTPTWLNSTVKSRRRCVLGLRNPGPLFREYFCHLLITLNNSDRNIHWPLTRNKIAAYLSINKWRNKLWCESTTNPVPVLRIAASRGFSELTKTVIRSSHGHFTPSLKISCKSVQPFSRNLANKETKI